MQQNKEVFETDVPDPTPYILNEKNKWITGEYIENLLKKYSTICKLKNIDSFRIATTHKSYLIRDENYYKNNKFKHQLDLEPIEDPTKAIPLQTKCNERHEYLGDSVIHLILADYLFTRYENQDEGFMTRLRTKIENGETLADLCKAIGLNEYVLISKYIEKNGGRENNKSILEDCFESFMGVLYQDVGFNTCQKFMINLLEQEVDFAQILHTETNFKDLLLQFFHQRKWRDPIYGQLDVSGPDHKKQFLMYVKCKKTMDDDGEMVGMSTASSKKAGEQNCAREALVKFGLIKDGVDSDDEDIEALEDIDDENDKDEPNKLHNSDPTSVNSDESIEEIESESEDDNDKTNVCSSDDEKLKCKKEFNKEILYKKHVNFCKK
ncbi:Ribonuclease III [uncultured virus]|nr:Ribonuclease III [uncultured virus]